MAHDWVSPIFPAPVTDEVGRAVVPCTLEATHALGKTLVLVIITCNMSEHLPRLRQSERRTNQTPRCTGRIIGAAYVNSVDSKLMWA